MTVRVGASLGFDPGDARSFCTEYMMRWAQAWADERGRKDSGYGIIIR